MQLTQKLIFTFILFLISCGQSGPQAACTPNYTGDGLSIYMRRIPTYTNTYEVTICENSRTNFRTISLYGVTDEARLDFVSDANVRLESIEDSTEVGDRFEVTFQNTDRWFAFYEDDVNGNLEQVYKLVEGQLPY